MALEDPEVVGERDGGLLGLRLGRVAAGAVRVNGDGE